jgi:hypothetical protein
MNQETKMNQETIGAFREVVKIYSYKGKKEGFGSNTDFVFFTGAGFSKAWDENFYGGKDLFETFSTGNDLFKNSLECYLQTMSWCKLGALSADEFKISFDDFKKVVLSIELYEKHSELRPKYIDSNGLKIIRKNLNALIALKIWKINPYLQCLSIRPSKKLTEEQKEIADFFNILREQKTYSRQGQDGIRINHITTNYDFVIESIFDNWFPEEDYESHLSYVYRGFTPNEYSGLSFIPVIKYDDPMESLFKLNGGLEIYCNPDGTYRMDYKKKELKDLQKESPLLVLPSYEQDYSNAYFKEILQKSKDLLTIAKVLIIVGYSLPEEDILIRFLLKHFALDKTNFQDKWIFYINKGDSHDQLKEKLINVFRESIAEPYFKQIHTFSGSFNEFVKQFLIFYKTGKFC